MTTGKRALGQSSKLFGQEGAANAKQLFQDSKSPVKALGDRNALKTPGASRLAGGKPDASIRKDKNAFVVGRGVALEHLEEWSGAGGDIFDSVERAYGICDRYELDGFKYDADGLGAGVRGDARVLNDARKREGLPTFTTIAFRGSGAVYGPEREDVKGRKNKDFFQNGKAQGWWSLRRRFKKTFDWVTKGKACDPDEIISIPSTLPYCTRLLTELSQPTFEQSSIGKLMVNKKPDGTKSPNLADGVMMLFAKAERGPMKISDEVLAAAAKLKRPRR